MVSLWMALSAAVFAAALAALVLRPLRAGGSHRPFVIAMLALGLAGGALYLLVGTPDAAERTATSDEPATLEDGVQALQQALAKDPQRADGWALLGRSQLALGKLAEATAAFDRAVRLAPDDPGILVEAAQARAQAAPGKQFDDQALQWLRHANALAPESERAGWLIGIALRQRGQDAEAAKAWEALLPTLEPGAARALREQIAIARGAAGLPPRVETPAPAAAGDHALAVQVRFAPGTAMDPAWANATVFVIARAPDGPPMPGAVQKHPASRLPLLVTLGDGDSPMPTSTLSQLQEVEVVARLSRSGQANRQPEDMETSPVRVRLPHAGPVSLVFDRP
ncbi:tetratricopeptide repeat protein [Stenotrophomonas rhizophila]